jgi:hypothetical protein
LSREYDRNAATKLRLLTPDSIADIMGMFT